VEKERIAKFLARAGVASRRESERLIAARRVTLNGVVVTHPATLVGAHDSLCVDRKAVAALEQSRIWRYHKPAGLMTTALDPQGRPTVFAALPKTLPRVISVGRLDFNTEGLLLLTNCQDLSSPGSWQLRSGGDCHTCARRHRRRSPLPSGRNHARPASGRQLLDNHEAA
jgi:23S rRNA pseudouridine2605 synthase